MTSGACWNETVLQRPPPRESDCCVMTKALETEKVYESPQLSETQLFHTSMPSPRGTGCDESRLETLRLHTGGQGSVRPDVIPC